MTSNVKHKPATPLPWNMQDGGRSNLAHVERDGDGTQVCSIPKVRVPDADYIAHAANAYPRLVEALRDALIRSDRTMATGSRDILTWQDDNRHQGDRLRSVLRSLGEDA